jgi:redox-sensitive bicupin YhaK (pirin superfamily)
MKTPQPLGFQWPTLDPFLFCVHHNDRYPAGNEQMGPAAPLAGRDLGQDFGGKDGWSMYHGRVVPGFPQHPHRGFETVTIVRQGLIDHSDSLGATARFGGGDVQWLTAGRGISHSEMFPLVHREHGNPAELFQIWLNLPRADKMVAPHFTMLWHESIPLVKTDGVEVSVIAGKLGDTTPLAPPPSSWGARAESDLAIWTLKLQPGARFTLPASQSRRMLYFFVGSALTVGGEKLPGRHAVELDNQAVTLENGPDAGEILILGGRPINEPVVQYGPFVMNTRAEIQEAFSDYQRTRFGGWPWPADDPVHARDERRFAKHADGRVEKR